MQWSTAYGMPTAIALSKGYSTWMKHVKNHRALHYWWVPDSTFIDMLPEPLTFARHSATEWLEGDKKSGAKGSYVSKLVSHNLQAKAGRVREFLGLAPVGVLGVKCLSACSSARMSPESTPS